jgi:hypothetical protein
MSARNLMLTVFFQSYSFAVIDILRQRATFTGEYFIQPVIAPLHQLPFHISRCQTAGVAMEEMNRLRCTRVRSQPSSPDFVIWDFYLFQHLKMNSLAHMWETAENRLGGRSEIVREIREDEKVGAFTHWIERCEWLADHDGKYYHRSSYDGIFIVKCQRVLGHPILCPGWGLIGPLGIYWPTLARPKPQPTEPPDHRARYESFPCAGSEKDNTVRNNDIRRYPQRSQNRTVY